MKKIIFVSVFVGLFLLSLGRESQARPAAFAEEKRIMDRGYDLSGIELTKDQANKILELILLGKKDDVEKMLKDLKAQRPDAIANQDELDKAKKQREEDLKQQQAAHEQALKVAADAHAAELAQMRQQIEALKRQNAVPQGGSSSSNAGAPVNLAGVSLKKRDLLKTIDELREDIAALKRQLAAGGMADLNAVDQELKGNIDVFVASIKGPGDLNRDKLKEVIADINVSDSVNGALLLLQEISDMYVAAQNMEKQERVLRADGRNAEADQLVLEINALAAKGEEIANTFSGTQGTFATLYKKQEAQKEKLSLEEFIRKAEEDYQAAEYKAPEDWQSPYYNYLKIDRKNFASLAPAQFDLLKAALNQTNKQELGAILYMTHQVIGYKPNGLGDAAAAQDKKKSFYSTMYDRYKAFSQGNPPAIVDARGLGDNNPDVIAAKTVRQLLENKVPVDYGALVASIKNNVDYQDSYQAIHRDPNHLQQVQQISPLCLVIGDKKLSEFKVFSDDFSGKAMGTFKYATLEELRAVAYHITNTDDLSRMPPAVSLFYKNLLKEIDDRKSRRIINRPENVQAVESNLFKKAFDRAKDGFDAPAPVVAVPVYDSTAYNNAKAEAAYGAENNEINTPAYLATNLNDSPLLGLLTVPADGFKKLQSNEIQTLEKAYKTATRKELKAILYHVLGSEAPFKENTDLINFAKSIQAIIKTRADDTRPVKAKIGDRNPVKTIISSL